VALDDIIGRMLSFARSLRAGISEPPEAPPTRDEPIRTRTMARLLASQGEHERAASIYRELRADAPDDAELRREADAVEAALEAAENVAPPVQTESIIERGVVAESVDATTALVSWSLDEATLREAAGEAASEGVELVARLVVFSPDAQHVVREDLRERRVERKGEWLVATLPEGAHVVGALGLRWGSVFVSVAHAAPVRLHKKG